jgi:catechol O-methyltransferase
MASRPSCTLAIMTLKQRVPFLRWSFWRLAIGARNITKTGQIGDGREAAAADYVVANARRGDIDDVIAKVDQFAYEKSFLINVGDEKGELLDAAVRRANAGVALELGTYCCYGSLRIARAAPSAKVFSVELSAANAEVARRIWAHAGDNRVTCVVGTIGDGGTTLDALAEHGFAATSSTSWLSTTTKTYHRPTCRASWTADGCTAAMSCRQHRLSGLTEVPRT